MTNTLSVGDCTGNVAATWQPGTANSAILIDTLSARGRAYVKRLAGIVEMAKIVPKAEKDAKIAGAILQCVQLAGSRHLIAVCCVFETGENKLEVSSFDAPNVREFNDAALSNALNALAGSALPTQVKVYMPHDQAARVTHVLSERAGKVTLLFDAPKVSA